MKRGEIWNVNFNPTKGDEISKIRPAIIISSDYIDGLRVKTVIPITHGFKKVRPWHVLLNVSEKNGLEKTSIADCNQMKSISISRFIDRRGVLNEDELSDIQITIMKVLELL